MVNIILALFILFQGRNFYCFKGCLKCTVDNICLYCDISQGYQLQYGACIKKTEEEFCKEKNSKSLCTECFEGYVLDFNRKCINLPLTKYINNCYMYQDNQCVVCKKGYYQANYICKVVDLYIENCDVYIQKDQCKECEQGFYLSQNGQKCIQIREKDRCFGYTNLNCAKCAKGYIYNENIFVEQLQKNYNEKQMLDIIIQDFSSQNYHIYNPNFCQKIIIENCEIPKNSFQCIKCQQGYFLDQNFLCQKFLKQSIENCEIYQSDDICSKCKSDYFTIDGKVCQEIPKIDNCIKYDQRKEYLNCVECQDDYYIDDKNVCLLRVLSHQNQIINCKKKDIRQDLCQQCIDNFTLSKDSLKCMQSLSNCKEHQDFFYNSDKIFCKICHNYYFLQDQQCVEGSVQNCQIYYTSEDKCKKCENGFYLNENFQCQYHKKLQNCSIYSDTYPNVCQQCSGEYYNFVIQQYCVNLDQIENCIEYDKQDFKPLAESICTKCEDGYYLYSNKCYQIKIDNCTQYDHQSELCQKCRNGYFLLSYFDKYDINQKRCELFQDHIKMGCQKFQDTSITQDIQCQVCKKNFIPFDIDEYFVCVNNSFIDYDIYKIQNFDTKCLKYKHGLCVQCEENYYIDLNTNQCLLNGCSNSDNKQNTYVPITFQNDGDYYQVQQIQKCIQDIDNVYIQTHDYYNFDLENRINIKCKDHTLDVVDLNIQDKSYSIYNIDGKFQSMMNKFPQVICPDQADIFYINEKKQEQQEQSYDNIQIQNCQYYINYEQNKYGCIRCKNGFKGYILQQNLQYIDECLVDNNCLISQQLQNLDVYWEKLVSCYACQDQNKIPYIIYNGKQYSNPEFESFQKISIENPIWQHFDGQEKLANIECLPNQVEDLAFALGVQDIQNIKLLQNCAINFLNTRYEKEGINSVDIQHANQFTEQQAILCVACKPGYYSLQHDLDHIYKIECIKIENCVEYGGEWLNSCSRCKDGYSYALENQQYNFEKCVESSVQNCYIMDTNIQKCVICQKGYILDKKNYCVKISIPQCKQDSFVQNIQTTNVKLLTYFHHNSYGCNKCQPNHVSVYMDKTMIQTNICVETDFLSNIPDENTESFLLNTIYIPYCERYKNDLRIDYGKIKCEQCQRNYVLTQSSDKCLQNEQYSNCLIVDEKQKKCIQCQSNNSLVNGQCVDYIIENCQKYNTNIESQQPLCLQCNDEYYINKKGLCQKGFVQNCLQYGESKDHCIKCNKNYYLIQFPHDDQKKSYCYPTHFNFQCEEAQISNNYYGANFYCTKCKHKNGVFIQPKQMQTKCLNFYAIENCLEYDINQELSQTTFLCKTCKEEFYISLSKNYCFKRKNMIQNCRVYKQDKDQCRTCEDNYYLDIDTQQCNHFPNGLPYCIDYKDLFTCSQCQENMYLQDNKCIFVPENYKIKNCIYYFDIDMCSQCIDGFILEDNKCIEIIIDNCEIAESAKDCKKCKIGYSLVTYNDRKQCLQIPIPNCLSYNFRIGICQKCDKGYYNNIQSGECAMVQHAIQYCEYYLNETQCSKCQQGFALSSDKNRCIIIGQFQDNKCEDLQIVEDLNCSICEIGYDLQNGECVQQDQQQNQLIQDQQGCLFSDTQQKNKCIICKPGYYMRYNQQCVFIIKQKERIFIFEFLFILNIKLFLLLIFQLIFKYQQNLFNYNVIHLQIVCNIIYLRNCTKQNSNIARKILAFIRKNSYVQKWAY